MDAAYTRTFTVPIVEQLRTILSGKLNMRLAISLFLLEPLALSIYLIHTNKHASLVLIRCHKINITD